MSPEKYRAVMAQINSSVAGDSNQGSRESSPFEPTPSDQTQCDHDRPLKLSIKDNESLRSQWLTNFYKFDELEFLKPYKIDHYEFELTTDPASNL